ncbi:MAG TPA: hypothetical protein VIK35_09065 [Verrucomicrobiae bacterium]
MKKTNPKLPPAAEWDFRQADRILLSEAAEYEYARQSDKIRVPLVRWLETPLKGKKVRQHILDACIKRQKETPNGKLLGELDSYFPKGIAAQIIKIGEKLTLQAYLYFISILQHRPDFPNPWTSMKVKGEWNEKFKRVHLKPMDQEFTFILERAAEWPKGWKDYLEMRRRISSGKYRLDIDFFADGRLSMIDEIVTDFEKWLRAEVKRTKPKMRIGRAAKVEQAAYPLKCLAALRLRLAGFTYEAAAELLGKFAITKEDAWFIPCFENAKSWTQAIQFAENKLAKIYS